MRRNSVAIATVGAGLLLAACESDHLTTSAASNLSPRHASANLVLSCNFTTMTNDAHLYFTNSTDPIFALITSMSTATEPTRTSLGFDILERIAAVRFTSSSSGSGGAPGPTPEKGGALIKDVVGCMSVGTIPDSFDPATALRSGIFEVRGASANAGPALAYTGTTTGTKVEFSPRYGVEPRTANGWPTGLGASRYVIYGYQTTGDFAGETPSDGLNAFEVGSLRADLPKDGLRVGICEQLVVTDPSDPTKGVAANVLIHNDQMIANESPNFCVGQTASGAKQSWLTRVASIFRPSIAFAQDPDGLSRDFIGGGPSGWSPMSWGKVNGADMNLKFDTQPKNTNITPDKIPAFVVHVQSDAGNSVPGVNVSVDVEKNNGLPAGAFLSGTVTVKTDASGNATFSNVSVNKAGGYRIVATGSLGGVKTNIVTSNLFNVKNK